MNQIENTSSIEYEYQIDPSEQPQLGSLDSNVTSTNLVIGSLNMVKSVDKDYATVGDILTYTIDIDNNGNILVSDVEFEDIMPVGLTFVPGSVTVDGTPQPTYNPNNGFNLGSMLILGSKNITFQAEVTSLPSPNTVSNQATTTFNYLVLIPVSGSALSNVVTTTINVSELSVVKSANVEYVTSGDTLTYTIVITNNGNIDATDIMFTDIIAPELTFVSGSVTVNGTPQPAYNPNDGFNLGTISPTSIITIVFDTTVN